MVIHGQKLKANTYSIEDSFHDCCAFSPGHAPDFCTSGFQNNQCIINQTHIFHSAHIGSKGIGKGGCTGTHQIMSRNTTESMSLNGNSVIGFVIGNLNHFLLPFLVGPSALG